MASDAATPASRARQRRQRGCRTALLAGRPRTPRRRAARSAPLQSLAEVDLFRSAASMIEVEGRIANDERRIASLQHRVDRRAASARTPARCRTTRGTARARAPSMSCELVSTAIERISTSGSRAEEGDRRHRAVGDDAHATDDQVRRNAALKLDRRNHADVDRALVQQRRASRRSDRTAAQRGRCDGRGHGPAAARSGSRPRPGE